MLLFPSSVDARFFMLACASSTAVLVWLTSRSNNQTASSSKSSSREATPVKSIKSYTGLSFVFDNAIIRAVSLTRTVTACLDAGTILLIFCFNSSFNLFLKNFKLLVSTGWENDSQMLVSVFKSLCAPALSRDSSDDIETKFSASSDDKDFSTPFWSSVLSYVLANSDSCWFLNAFASHCFNRVNFSLLASLHTASKDRIVPSTDFVTSKRWTWDPPKFSIM